MNDPCQPSPGLARRELLRRAALALGGLVAAPSLAALLAACDRAPSPESGGLPTSLDARQLALVRAIVDQIIPRTDTPGATDAGVDRFVDRMLGAYYGPAERARFLAGLAEVDRRSRSATGAAFVDAPPAAQRAILTALDADAYALPRDRSVGAPFFRMIKDLTLVGYYTSEAGATRELRYDRVPGHFSGCVPLASLGRAAAV